MRTVMALVLGLVVLAPAGAAVTSQGLYGVATRGPTKPVCSVGAACSEPAAHTRLLFARGSRITSITTDARGRFRVGLRPGIYSVRVAGAPARGVGGRITPASVRVQAAWRHQNFDIDTGIR